MLQRHPAYLIFVFLLLTTPAWAGSDSLYFIGKSVFTGKHVAIDSFKSCTSCHMLQETDTLNWNPSAYDISIFFADTTEDDFAEAVMYPLSDKMWESHDGYEFEQDTLNAIQFFLKNIKEKGRIEPPLDKHRPIIFITMVVLFTIVLIDFLTRRFLKFKVLYLVLFLGTFLSSGHLIATEIINSKLNIGYEPNQPVKFSHQIHCAQNEISCKYCHYTAERSQHATIPGTAICMNCHGVILTGTRSGEHEIRKILASQSSQTPIEWVRVSKLPEHVQFNHAIHTLNGLVACETCHGDVKNMVRIQQAHRFSMDWCLDCHMKTAISTKSNFYSASAFHHADSLTIRQLNGWECLSCHH